MNNEKKNEFKDDTSREHKLRNAKRTPCGVELAFWKGKCDCEQTLRTIKEWPSWDVNTKKQRTS